MSLGPAGVLNKAGIAVSGGVIIGRENGGTVVSEIGIIDAVTGIVATNPSGSIYQLDIDTAVVCTLTGTQTLTNKTITSPTIDGSPVIDSGTITLNDASTDIVGDNDVNVLSVWSGAGASPTNGAGITMQGVSSGGVLTLNGGNTANGNVVVTTNHATSAIDLQHNTTSKMQVQSDAVELYDSLRLTEDNSFVCLDTADGSDTKALYVQAHGQASSSTQNRGGNVILFGNENVGNPGRVVISAGHVTNSDIRFRANSANFQYHMDATSFSPLTTNTYDLGKSTVEWKILYCGAIIREGNDIIFRTTTASKDVRLQTGGSNDRLKATDFGVPIFASTTEIADGELFNNSIAFWISTLDLICKYKDNGGTVRTLNLGTFS